MVNNLCNVLNHLKEVIYTIFLLIRLAAKILDAMCEKRTLYVQFFFIINTTFFIFIRNALIVKLLNLDYFFS